MHLELINYKDLIVRQNENNSLSPRSSQTDSSTSNSDNSSLLVDIEF